MSVIEAVRKRPGMYIGDNHSPHGIAGLVLEIFSNVADLFLVQKATRVSIQIDPFGWVEIADDGPGFPFDQTHESTGLNLFVKHLTLGHDAPTADGHIPHVHFSLGVGLVVLNALSDTLEITSNRHGTRYFQRFRRGKAEGGATQSSSDKEPSGTRFRFLPDREIFKTAPSESLPLLRAKLFSAAHLLPGFRIELGEEVFCAPGGLGDFVRTLCLSDSSAFSHAPVIEFQGKHEFCEINFACGGSFEDCESESDPCDDRPWVRSWANGIFNDRGGVHADGMMRALAKTNLRPEAAMLSIVLADPRFAAPTRSKLVNPEIGDAVESALTEHFRSLGLLGHVG